MMLFNDWLGIIYSYSAMLLYEYEIRRQTEAETVLRFTRILVRMSRVGILTREEVRLHHKLMKHAVWVIKKTAENSEKTVDGLQKKC